MATITKIHPAIELGAPIDIPGDPGVQSADDYFGGQYLGETYRANSNGADASKPLSCTGLSDTADLFAKWKGVLFDDIKLSTERNYLVKGVIDCAAYAAIYGEPKSGKSFIALDMAVHVACGLPWCGRRVQQTAVVYIAAEGGGGIAKRVEAIRQRHGKPSHDIPIMILRTPVNLLDKLADVNPLVNAILDFKEVSGQPVGLIIVDTLSRSFGGGNENAPDAMGTFVGNCDSIKARTGSAMLIVHHCGKDAARGMRGSSVLLGAVDTEIEVVKGGGQSRTQVDKTGLSTVSITANRDGEECPLTDFELQVVTVGTDVDNEAITTCIVEKYEPTPATAAKPVRLTDDAKIAKTCLLNVLVDASENLPSTREFPSGGHTIGAKLSTWRENFYAAKGDGQTKTNLMKQFQRAKDRLQAADVIKGFGEYVWLVDSGGQ